MSRIHVPLAAALLGCSAALLIAPAGAQTTETLAAAGARDRNLMPGAHAISL